MTKEQFADIVRELPESESIFFAKGADKEENKAFFRKMIERRIQHCESQLKNNLDNARATMTGQIVFWEGGHFSYPVWEALKEAINQPLDKWDRLIWQQIIRQMAEDHVANKEAYYIATEYLLVL